MLLAFLHMSEVGLEEVQRSNVLVRERSAPRVLLAEDDEALRRMLAHVLRREGLIVDDVADGGSMLVRLAATYGSDQGPDLFDLIISDVRMPISSGLDVLRALREAEWNSPFILITAYGDEQTREIARAYDATLVEKPLSLAKLRKIVSARLGS